MDKRSPSWEDDDGMSAAQIIGKQGEDAATAHLRTLGYRIRERNARLGHDEIDIVAFDPTDHALVFVEVKTLRRCRQRDQHPAAGFTGIKKRRTLRAARKWIAQHAYEKGYRIDLVCVVGQRVIEHLREVNFEY
ncbi:MAG: YraN family protein [Candidatus Peribacteraceae bacterium]